MICDVVASVLRAAAWSKSATSTTQSSADSTVAVSATFSAILLSKSSRLSSNPHGIALNGIPVSSSGTSTLCVCKTIRTSSLISHPRHNKSRLSKRGLIRSVKKTAQVWREIRERLRHVRAARRTRLDWRLFDSGASHGSLFLPPPTLHPFPYARSQLTFDRY